MFEFDNWTEKAIGILVCMLISIAIIIYGSCNPKNNNCNIEKPHYHDGDLYYIDTTVKPCPEIDWTKVNIDTTEL